MKRASKALFSIFAMLLLTLTVNIPLSAEAYIDTQATGRITLALTDSSEEHVPVTGATFVLYRVADITERGEITFTEQFKHAGVSVDTIFGERIAEHLSFYAKNNDIQGINADSGETNYVEFTQLPVGIYVVAQSNILYDYLPCSPFAVAIPTETEQGTIEYNVNASPKVSIRQESDASLSTKLTVNKLWDGGTLHPEITVVLTRDGELYETVELNSSNNWTHTWEGLDIAYAWFAAELRVPDDFTVSYSCKGHTIIMTNDTELDVPDYPTEVTTSPPVIDTGLISWPIPVLAGVGILLFAAGYIIFMRKK